MLYSVTCNIKKSRCKQTQWVIEGFMLQVYGN